MTEETLFHEALAKPPAERVVFLDAACAGQPQLRAAVEALLAAHEASASLLDRPPGDLGQTVDSSAPSALLGTGEYMTEPLGTSEYIPRLEDTSAHEPATGDPRPTLRPGTVIAGRYTLVEKLGEGGMGEVWIAQQTEPVKRKVALKLIKSGMDSRGVLARFEQERQTLALMDHPNIARVLDGGITPTGEPFFVMELVQGQTLTKFCDEARMTPRQRLELFVPICQAVQHAHQKGIVHRDLKPGNILVTRIDGKPVPRVIDFGVAKATGEQLTDDAMLTQVGAIVGTLEYMSPEQAGLTGGDIDTRADIYALGVILYELLTGLRPIDIKRLKKAALGEIIRVIQDEEPARPSTRLSTDEALPSLAGLRQTEPRKLMALLRSELDWVVLKCLEKQRDRRYDTANALARDIQRYLTDEPVEARPPSRGYRLRKLIKRNKVQVIAGTFVLLALIGGIIGTSIGMMQADSARAGEKAEREKAEGLAEEKGKLADKERAARESAVAAEQEKEKQLRRAQAILMNSQLERAENVYEKDPLQALRLITDIDACPIEHRDLAWSFIDHACKRYWGDQIPLRGSFHALSPDGKWLVAVEKVTKVEVQERQKPLPPRRVLKHLSSTLRVVEAATGKVRATLPQSSESIGPVSFSPDGNGLAVVVYQGAPEVIGPPAARRVAIPNKVQLWDVAGARKIATLDGHADAISHLIHSPDGKRLFTSARDDTTSLWDPQTGKKLHDLADFGKGLQAAAFSPDGARLFACFRDGTARIWDAKTGKKLHDLADFGKGEHAAFSPDGKRLATGGTDNKVKVWDVESGKLVTSWTPEANTNPVLARVRKQGSVAFNERQDRVVALDFSPDGGSVVAGNTSWLIEIRDAASGTLRQTLRDPQAPASWVRFHSDGKSVMAALKSNNGVPDTPEAVARWDVKTGQRLITLPLAGNGTFNPPAFCKGADLVVVPRRGRYEIIDFDVPLERARFETDKVTGPRTVSVFSRAGDVLAVGAGDRIFLWDVKTGKLRHTLRGHKNSVHGLAVSPDGRTLASSSAHAWIGFINPNTKVEPDDIRLWDVSTGESLGTIPVGVTKVVSVAFSPDGSALAAIYRAKPKDVQGDKNRQLLNPSGVPTLTVWDVKTRKPRFTREHPNADESIGLADDYMAVAFNPATGALVSACGRSLCVWDAADGRRRRQGLLGSMGFGAGGGWLLEGLAISPDGKTIVTNHGRQRLTSKGRTVTFWDAETAEQLKRVEENGFGCVAFGPDGRNVISTSGSSVVIWDTLTRQRQLSYTAHAKGRHASLAVSPDGQTFATAVIASDESRGGFNFEGPVEVKLWDVSRSPVVLTAWGRILPDQRGGLGVMFGRDRTLIEPDGSGVIRLWDLDRRLLRTSVDTTRHNIATSSIESVVSPKGRYLAGKDVVGTAEERQLAVNLSVLKQSADVTGQVNLLDTTTGTIRAIPVGKGAIQSMTFSPDESRLAIVHYASIKDGKTVRSGHTVEVFDVETNRSERIVHLGAGDVLRLALSPDNRTLAMETARTADTAKPPSEQNSVVSIQLLDVEKGEELAPLNHGGGRYSRTIWFTKDGNRLVIQSLNVATPSTIWDWRAGKRVDEPVPEAPAVHTRVSYDGRYELRDVTGRIEVIDRTVKPPEVVSRRTPQEGPPDRKHGTK